MEAPTQPHDSGSRGFQSQVEELCNDGAKAGNRTEPSSRVKTGRASHNCLPRPGSPARRRWLGGRGRPSAAGAHMPGLLRDVLAICSCQPGLGLGPGLCAVAGDVPSRPAVATLPSCAPRHDRTAVSAPGPQNWPAGFLHAGGGARSGAWGWGCPRGSRSSLRLRFCLPHASPL